MIQLK